MKSSILKAFKFILFFGALLWGASDIHALPTSYFTTSSRLANGRWVKIEVDTTGVYAITYDQLRAWGFSRPDRVAVFGTGAVVPTEHNFVETVPDDLPAAPAISRGNRLIFYAEGDTRAVPTSDRSAVFTRNYYDTHSYYFLTEAEEPIAAMPATAYDGNPSERSVIDRSLAISICEPEEYIPGFGGAQFFSNPIAPGTVRRFTLPVEDFTHRRNGGSRIGYLGFTYIANQEESGQYSPTVTLDDSWTVTAADYGRTDRHAATTLFSNRSGSLNFSAESTPGALDITFGVPADFSGDFWCVDKIYAVYTQLNRLGSSPWRMLNLTSVNAGTPVSVAGAPDNLEVWNVTDPAAPTRLLPDFGDDGTALVTLDRTYSSSTSGQILIFDSAADFPTPNFCGEVANQNLHGITEVPQMLIVTTRSMLESARELAQIHASTRNFDVIAVCQDDIFNEFSSGSRSPQAIHRFAKMLHDRDAAGRFGYILLYGPSVSDNRFINCRPGDVLVSMQAENSSDVSSNSTNYCTDVYFGMVDDSFDMSKLPIQYGQLSVGRLPVQTQLQASGVNRKIERFITNPTPPAAAMRAFFLSDVDASATADEHTVHNDTARANLRRAFPDMVFSNLDLIEYSGLQESKGQIQPLATERFRRELKDGCGLIWYSGHAAQANITSPIIWDFEKELGNSNSFYPWGVFSTCLMFNFDASSNSLLELMVLNPDGGLIGGTASGREVYLVYNEWLNLAMARQLAAATPGMTMADVFRLARNSIIPPENPTIANNRSKNALCYNYCGDPSLPLYIPSESVVFEIEGQEEIATLSALTETTVNAAIAGASDFNGSGQLRLFSKRVYRNRQPDTAQSTRSMKSWLGFLEHTFVDEADLIAEYPVTVENGRISASVVLPAVELDSARMYIYVRDAATGHLATGHTLINTRIPDSPDTDFALSSFEATYIDTPDAVSGSVVARPGTFHAIVNPGGAGIKTNVAGMGRLKCIVDGQTNLNKVLSATFNADGRLEIYCKLPDLADGTHWIETTVTDYAGNAVCNRYDFTLDSAPLTADVSVDFGQASVARDYVEVDLADIPAGAEVTAVTVTDASGATVCTAASPALPWRWNLTDAGGVPVADGAYRVHAKLRRDNSYGATPEAAFTVIRR